MVFPFKLLSLAGLVGLLLIIPSSIIAFYLPGANPQSFAEGDE
jgi:hypothetical protein